MTESVLGKLGTISPMHNRELHNALGICRDYINSENNGEISKFFFGKRILVTGGAGSIGSNLCRMLCSYSPKSVAVFDVDENNGYLLYCELKSAFPNVNVEFYLGSVCDQMRFREVMSAVKPQVVFHAAAHKHVPVLQTAVKQGVKNNVFGTLNAINLAKEFGVKTFVLVSSDKAVNPVGVMGMTKRVCEMLIQAQAGSKTRFCAVRFGNVFASNGSVVPIFLNQIQKGEPLTLTSEQMNRYFITVNDACGLLLLTATKANSGEVFMLDMGSPINLLTLAKTLISFYGNGQEQIKVIGLREGERLQEELQYKNEPAKQLVLGINVCTLAGVNKAKLERNLKLLSESANRFGRLGEKGCEKLLKKIISL